MDGMRDPLSYPWLGQHVEPRIIDIRQSIMHILITGWMNNKLITSYSSCTTLNYCYFQKLFILF